MEPKVTRAARRELGLVLCLAVVGLVLVFAVAFAPWYDPVVLGLG